MPEKDITEKLLISCADVFADCINVLAYGGEQRLEPGDLQHAPTESFYQGRERKHNQLCDKSFYHMEEGKIRTQYIIENETRMKRRQVLRKASYQGGAYREQLDSGIPIYPVISIVLDWTRKSTRMPMSIHKILKEQGRSEEELRLVDNVELAVYHMRNLSGTARSRFKSDMGFVADYLNEGSFENRKQQVIRHGEELSEMMEALTGDRRFTEQMEELRMKREGREEGRMCEYIDMLEARGEEKAEIRLSKLIQFLLKEKKYSDIEKATSSREKCHELYRLYGI